MSELEVVHSSISTCEKCGLCRGRTHAVPGEGPGNAKIVFIGEGPGFYEDQQGRPFVGPAGKVLEELLATIHLKRSDVYITNIIKCRAPGNRDPLPGEIDACSDWLDRQLELIAPRMIVTLGRYSMARFFPKQTISKIHGTAKKQDGYIIYAMYHPAAALHQQGLRNAIIEDMKKIPRILAEADEIPEEEQQPEQLSMF
ncbi:MAG: uracil-DNA glycosylase [Dehalococcoidia bacterium]